MIGFQWQDNWEDALGHRGGVIFWGKAGSNNFSVSYRAVLEGHVLEVRMNDFPDEPLYTLIANGVEVIHFNEWPVNWHK